LHRRLAQKKEEKISEVEDQPRLSDAEVITMENQQKLIVTKPFIDIFEITGCPYFLSLEFGPLFCVRRQIFGR